MNEIRFQRLIPDSWKVTIDFPTNYTMSCDMTVMEIDARHISMSLTYVYA